MLPGEATLDCSTLLLLANRVLTQHILSAAGSATGSSGLCCSRGLVAARNQVELRVNINIGAFFPAPQSQ
jgi:hypothetical protein